MLVLSNGDGPHEVPRGYGTTRPAWTGHGQTRSRRSPTLTLSLYSSLVDDAIRSDKVSPDLIQALRTGIGRRQSRGRSHGRTRMRSLQRGFGAGPPWTEPWSPCLRRIMWRRSTGRRRCDAFPFPTGQSRRTRGGRSSGGSPTYPWRRSCTPMSAAPSRSTREIAPSMRSGSEWATRRPSRGSVQPSPRFLAW